MRNRIIPTLVALLGTFLLFSPTLLHAEISVGDEEFYSYIIVMGMTQEPDPITSAIWTQLIPESEVLNPDGDLREDGPPYVEFNATAGGPVVVWAYNSGNDFDIAISSWNGSEWEEIEFLTSSTDSELDPRLAVTDSGDFHVVYWVKESEEIFVTTRPHGSQVWNQPEQVSIAGRHPAITFEGDSRMIAYERDGAGNGQEVVVHTRTGGQTTEEVIAATPYTDSLQIQLHRRGARLWMDWVHSENSIGYTQYLMGIWGVIPGYVPWPDHSWIGVEDARRSVQFEVLKVD